jgi:hypothetical protein
MKKKQLFELIVEYISQNHPEIYMEAVDAVVTEDELNETFGSIKLFNHAIQEEAERFLQSFGVR